MEESDKRKGRTAKGSKPKKVARSLMESEPIFRTVRNSVPLTANQLLRVVLLDHSYAQPTIPAEKKTHCFPVRFLFRDDDEILALNEIQPKSDNGTSKKQPSKRAQKSKSIDDIEIDVVIPDPEPKLAYDEAKALAYMKECEKNVNFARLYDVGDDWEEKVNKSSWTKIQRRLFDKIVQIFHSDYLSRLAIAESSTAPIHRRLSVDKSAEAVREVLTQIGWNTRLIQWLHRVLVDHLSFSYLAVYLDVLQTLRAKVPVLIDRMVAFNPSVAIAGKPDIADTCDLVNVEALNLLLKRKWDPFTATCHPSKFKKNSLSPVFLVVPAGPPGSNGFSLHRQKSLLSMLSGVGKVVQVTMNSSSNKLSVDAYSEKMLNTTKSKLVEIVCANPDKPVYLLGWGSGAVVAAKIAKTEKVSGVICIGFPLYGLFGSRNDVDGDFFEMKNPVLFIVGDDATNNNITDMEIFRKGLNCINALSVICHADSYLRIQNYHQKRMLVTQSYVDKCIVDEISWFLVNVPTLKEELQAQALAQAEASQQDRQKAIPSNSSSSKRKAYFRNTTSRDNAIPNYITASKLVQQSNTKRKQSLNGGGSATPTEPPMKTGSVNLSSNVSNVITKTNSKTSKLGSAIPAQPNLVSHSLPAGGSSGKPVYETGVPSSVADIKVTSSVKRQDDVNNSSELSSSRSNGETAAAHICAPTNLLRYQLSKGTVPTSTTQPSVVLNKPVVLKKERVIPPTTTSSATTTPSEKPGLPSTTPVMPLNTDILRRITSSQGLSTAPKQDLNNESRVQAITQFVRQIPSLQATFQQLHAEKSGETGGRPNFSGDTCRTHIIRVTPITFTAAPSGSKLTGINTNSGEAASEKPLPTRCTDDSLSSIEAADGFTSHLFQHLKPALAGSKEAKVIAITTTLPASQSTPSAYLKPSADDSPLSSLHSTNSSITGSSDSSTSTTVTSLQIATVKSSREQLSSAPIDPRNQFSTGAASDSANDTCLGSLLKNEDRIEQQSPILNRIICKSNTATPEPIKTPEKHSVTSKEENSTSQTEPPSEETAPPAKLSKPEGSASLEVNVRSSDDVPKRRSRCEKNANSEKIVEHGLKPSPASVKAARLARRAQVSNKKSQEMAKSCVNTVGDANQSKKLSDEKVSETVKQMKVSKSHFSNEAALKQRKKRHSTVSTAPDHQTRGSTTRKSLGRKSKLSNSDEDAPPTKISKSSAMPKESKSAEKRKSEVKPEPAKEVSKPQSRRTSRQSTSSVEIIESSASEDEAPSPRLTRSKARHPTSSNSGDSSEGSKEIDQLKPTETPEKQDDPDACGKLKFLKPIHPVSPASLSASRTRKISIPKYFAYGM